MTRSDRLHQLLQLLRRHRRPVTGATIAGALDISLRTLYRDIATLQAQGARIDGAPGLGYVLVPGFDLLPLMFSVDELEALALGSRWVAERGDTHLAAAARDALAKIAAVVPPPLRHELDSAALLVGPGTTVAAGDAEITAIRQAIRAQRKLDIDYRALSGQASRRTVWPFALGFFDQARVLVAWCEARDAVRHFRVDRIERLSALDTRYPRARQALLVQWRQAQGIEA